MSQRWGFIYFIISLLYNLDAHNDTYKSSDILFYVGWIIMGNFQVSTGSAMCENDVSRKKDQLPNTLTWLMCALVHCLFLWDSCSFVSQSQAHTCCYSSLMPFLYSI